MRVGDLSLAISPVDGGSVLEQADGQVLARPGQVYGLRLTNHAPLRAVVEIRLDGALVSGDGLVLNAGSTTTLERPIHATERGRFTVIAEGNEAVFGPDGGRSNPDLGLIEVRYRRELPRPVFVPVAQPTYVDPWPLYPRAYRIGGAAEPGPHVTFTNADVMTANTLFRSHAAPDHGCLREQGVSYGGDHAVASDSAPMNAVERAAGTGLTGTSRQEFHTVHLAALETEVTILRMRLVIGAVETLAAARPLPTAPGPVRPEPRP